MVVVVAFQLTDEQWAEIFRYSGLPSEARSEIERVIGEYRHFRANNARRPTPHHMRTYFKGLRNDILALRNQLKMINIFDATFIGFERPGGPTRRPGVRFEGRDLCENAIHALGSLARWCQGAGDEIFVPPRGSAREARSIHWLISALDSTREEYTGNKISRSRKWPDTSREYITSACQIADPTISPGSIENAMKKRITEKRLVAKSKIKKRMKNRAVDEIPPK
jgi:hypothetical protein